MFSTGTYIRTSASKSPLKSLASRQSVTLLALLAIYVAIVLIGSSAAFKDGDEAGYVAYAMRIAHVPQSLDLRLWWGAQDPQHWWGPGYPLILAPFALMGWPWLAAKLLNALFLTVAIAYVGVVVKRYTNGSIWLVVTLCLGLYPAFLRALPALGPESLMVLLVCGFMFHFCALFQDNRPLRPHLIGASLYLAYLALTQIFFGYVIGAILALLLVGEFASGRTRSGLHLESSCSHCCGVPRTSVICTRRPARSSTGALPVGALSIGYRRRIQARTAVGIPIMR